MLFCPFVFLFESLRIVLDMTYWGLSFNTSNLGGNHYIYFAISGGVEILAYITDHIFLDRAGRRLMAAAFSLAGGTTLLCTLAVPKGIHNIYNYI